jgi:hypothetical protein
MVVTPHDDDHKPVEPKLDEDEDDVMALNSLCAFEDSMVGAYAVRKKPGCKSEPKAKAKSSPKCTAKTSPAMKLVLGCGKCRGAPGGCGVCRNPAFKGKRGAGCKAMKAMEAMKAMKMAMKKTV